MSNHEGGHMLNEVLQTLDNYQVFNWLGLGKTQELVQVILKIGYEYDCNYGEILAEIGRKLGTCGSCARPANIVYRDLCQQCFLDHYEVDENGDISLNKAYEEWGYTPAQLLEILKAEKIAFRQEGQEYYANYITLEKYIKKNLWGEE